MAISSHVAGVIVADDDAMIRSVLRYQLDALEQTVFLASDGLEAVELASRMQANLILLDLAMPRLNGLLACQRIRLLPNNAKTPIVILTSSHSEDAAAAAARVGATAFLTKPFRSAELLLTLSRFLQMTDGMRQATLRAAGRSAEIAKSAASRPPAQAPSPATAEGPRDRGKDFITVLRG